MGPSLSNSMVMDLLNATADHDRQGTLLTDVTVKSHTVVEFAEVRAKHNDCS